MKKIIDIINEDFTLKKKGNIITKTSPKELIDSISKQCLSILYGNYNKLVERNDKEVVAFKKGVEQWINDYNIANINETVIFTYDGDTLDTISEMWEISGNENTNIKTYVGDPKMEKLYDDSCFKSNDKFIYKTYFESYPKFCMDEDLNSSLIGNDKALTFSSQIDIVSTDTPYPDGSFTIYFIA